MPANKPPFDGEWVRLGELCAPKQWKSLKQSEMTSDGYPVYGANGVIGYYSEYNHEEETILVGCRGTCGEVNLCAPYSYVTSNAMCLDRLSDRVDRDYLICFLKAYNFGRVIGGTSQPQITKAGISSIEVPLFSLEKQIVIRLRLKSILDELVSCKALLAKLDTLVKSRFVEMFGGSGWPVATVGSLATDIRYGTSKKASDSGQFVYLRMNNMTDGGGLDFDDVKYIDLDGSELDKCLVVDGDLLFNRTNSREKVGKTAVFHEKEPMVIAGYIIRVRLGDRIRPDFLAAYMNLPTTKAMLRSIARGAVHQANINSKELSAIEVPVPPICLQDSFLAFVAEVDKSRFIVQQKIEKLQTLYDSLAQKYFG